MLETERLTIRIASDDEMKNFIAKQDNDILKAAYTEMLEGSMNNPDKRCWYAIWMIDMKENNVHIGEVSFKGIDDDGIVEIGYGINERYQGQGLATEAVTAVAKWAVGQKSVTRVEAESEADNIPSRRVLEKAGFVQDGTMGEEGPRYVLLDSLTIQKAGMDDLAEILDLQYLAYQSEAELFGTQDIPPLKQTLDEVVSEYHEGIILKIIIKDKIIASVRAKVKDSSVLIGKLMVHPDFRRKGLGKRMLREIEKFFPEQRYELFTSTKSENSIKLYESLGYKIFNEKKIKDDLSFVYLKKTI